MSKRTMGEKCCVCQGDLSDPYDVCLVCNVPLCPACWNRGQGLCSECDEEEPTP